MAVLVLLMLHQHRDHILIQINILFCIFKQLFQLAIYSGQEAYFVAILSLNQRDHFLVLAGRAGGAGGGSGSNCFPGDTSDPTAGAHRAQD